MKADEYRYWQSRPAYERIDAVEEMIRQPTLLKVGRSSQMYQDYKDLLSAFDAHGIKHLIGGGYAVIFHAQPRWRTSARRSKAFAPKTFRRATISSALEMIRAASTSFLIFPVLILTQHGNGGLKRLLTRRADCTLAARPR